MKIRPIKNMHTVEFRGDWNSVEILINRHERFKLNGVTFQSFIETYCKRLIRGAAEGNTIFEISESTLKQIKNGIEKYNSK